MNLKDGKGQVPIRNQTTNDQTPWLLVAFPTQKEFKSLYPHLKEELRDKYWKILVLRAGGKTLTSSGAPFGITRERARQIEAKFQRLVGEKYWSQTRWSLTTLSLAPSATILASMPDSL